VARLKEITGSEAGFTLIELMVVSVLTMALLAISVGALRSYWQERALTGGQDQVVTQMREAQSRSVAESYPLVYGIRFLKGTSSYGVVRYNSANQTCQVVNNQSLADGVKVDTAGTDFPDVTTATVACRGATPIPAGATTANYEVVFFYPKGTANATSPNADQVLLSQPGLGRTREITVSALTGRVVRS
jgi:Tfp pilus assembly protein FimT